MRLYWVDAHSIMFADITPIAEQTEDTYCDKCPYDKGEGMYCVGHCLKEIIESKGNGG